MSGDRQPKVARRQASDGAVAALGGAAGTIRLIENEADDGMEEPKDEGPGATMFVPPFASIMERLTAGAADADEGGNDAVIVPQKFLRFLLRCLLDHVDFDEAQYRACNPDVEAAIGQESFATGREHFVATGYFEGRAGGTSVLETWYLARNPDVAAAKQRGKVASGEMQYRLAGAREWREPNPEAVGWIRAWRDALE